MPVIWPNAIIWLTWRGYVSAFFGVKIWELLLLVKSYNHALVLIIWLRCGANLPLSNFFVQNLTHKLALTLICIKQKMIVGLRTCTSGSIDFQKCSRTTQEMESDPSQKWRSTERLWASTAMAALLPLLLLFLAPALLDASDHRYNPGDAIPLYVNKVGPYHNPRYVCTLDRNCYICLFIFGFARTASIY